MADAQDMLKVEIKVDELPELDEVHDDLVAVGATDIEVPPEGQTVLPLLVIVGAIAGAVALADLIMRLRAKTSCQEIIDARGESVKISKNCDFKDGRIVVISSDAQKVEIHDVPDGIDVTKIVEAALAGGAEAVKAAAEAAGARATEPQPAG
jgi:hypothetical protein